MVTRKSLFSSLALGVVAALSISGTAVADPPPNPPGAPELLRSVHFQTRNQMGIKDLDSGIANSGTFLLNGFRFHFDNGDHRLKRIAAASASDLAWNGKVTMGIADDNNDDPWNGEIWGVMVNDPRIELGVMDRNSGRGGGGQWTCEEQIGERPGFTFAIRGFDFRYTHNTDDHNFKSMLIEYLPGRGKVLARIKDDDRDDRVQCRIQYAWIPNDLLAGSPAILASQVGATDTGPSSEPFRELAGGRAVFLSKLFIAYTDGDESIVKFQYHIQPGGYAHWELRDGNGGNRVNWEATAHLIR